jgi:hypothetical protein
MKNVLDGTNLLAGGIAAALLVVLVFALGVPLWLGVVLAVAAFVGVALLAPGGGRATEARAVVERYLLPSRRLLTQYARLAGRGVASAGPAIAKIEENDLPLLDRKLRELYEGLHRGDVIDLEVASEMLEFDLAGVEPASPRRLDG